MRIIMEVMVALDSWAIHLAIPMVFVYLAGKVILPVIVWLVFETVVKIYPPPTMVMVVEVGVGVPLMKTMGVAGVVFRPRSNALCLLTTLWAISMKHLFKDLVRLVSQA